MRTSLSYMVNMINMIKNMIIKTKRGGKVGLKLGFCTIIHTYIHTFAFYLFIQ